MITEEMLVKARNDYPDGTEYICASSSNKNDKSRIMQSNSKSYTRYSHYSIDAGYGLGYLYYDGEWAKITKSVVPQVINNYQIY